MMCVLTFVMTHLILGARVFCGFPLVCKSYISSLDDRILMHIVCDLKGVFLSC